MGAAAWLVAVRIGVLGIFSPTHVVLVAGSERHELLLVQGGLRVDGATRDAERVEGRPLVEVTVLGSDGKPRIRRSFRGALTARVRGGAIELIDELSDEEYLPGTVALEAQGTHPEALRAQAVMARTVVRRGARHAAEGFDLCDLTHCQTYRGVDGETDAARAAVTTTTGEVLVRDGRPAEVYFTSSCGGATADESDVWGAIRRSGAASTSGPRASGSRSVPCETCRRAGGPPWQARLTLADVDRAVAAGGRLTGVSVVARGAGGVVRRVRLDGDGRELSGEELRILLGRERAIGWSRVLSPRFEVSRSDGGLLFVGRGNGHLVGVCEAGVADLARAGIDHRAILRRYLPGTDVTRSP